MTRTSACGGCGCSAKRRICVRAGGAAAERRYRLYGSFCIFGCAYDNAGPTTTGDRTESATDYASRALRVHASGARGIPAIGSSTGNRIRPAPVRNRQQESARDSKHSAADPRPCPVTVWLLVPELSALANNNSAPAQAWYCRTFAQSADRRGVLLTTTLRCYEHFRRITREHAGSSSSKSTICTASTGPGAGRCRSRAHGAGRGVYNRRACHGPLARAETRRSAGATDCHCPRRINRRGNRRLALPGGAGLSVLISIAVRMAESSLR